MSELPGPYLGISLGPLGGGDPLGRDTLRSAPFGTMLSEQKDCLPGCGDFSYQVSILFRSRRKECPVKLWGTVIVRSGRVGKPSWPISEVRCTPS